MFIHRVKYFIVFFISVFIASGQISVRYTYYQFNSDEVFASNTDPNFKAGERRPFDIFNGGYFKQTTHLFELLYQVDQYDFSLKLPYTISTFKDDISTLKDDAVQDLSVAILYHSDFISKRLKLGIEYRQAFKNPSIELSVTEASKDISLLGQYEYLFNNSFQTINLKQNIKYTFRSEAIDRDIDYGNQIETRSELGVPFNRFYIASEFVYKFKNANRVESVLQESRTLSELSIKFIYMVKKTINTEFFYSNSISGRNEVAYQNLGIKLYYQFN